MIKAIFFDVDGTLLSFVTHRMPPSTPAALHALRRRGIKLFLCTGRHPGMVEQLCREFPFDGVVSLTGQHCASGGQLIHHLPLSPAAMEDILPAVRTLGLPGICYGGEEIFTHSPGPDVEFFREAFDLPPLPTRPLEHALTVPVYQMVLFLDREGEAALHALLPGLNCVRWHPRFLEVLPAGGGKDVGIAAVLDHLGICREEIMAFGDGGNDLPMLRYAGIGVAMGNAGDEVKAEADYVTSAVDEDGIAAALTHFGLL